jgi:hypothetical protein
MQIASLPVMDERKKQWRDVKDLRAAKPMILVETAVIDEFVPETEQECEDPYLRNVEKNMLMNIQQYTDVGDDLVLEPYFHIGWQLKMPNFGMESVKQNGLDSSGGRLGYALEPTVKNVEDINKLKKRSFSVDRKLSHEYKSRLEDIFGDILPVKLGNANTYESLPGFSPYLGVNFFFITYELMELLGNENFLIWPYDHPEELHELSGFLLEDKINLYLLMENEGILCLNTDNHWAGPGSYGYCSDLPPADTPGAAGLSNCWGRTESQESVGLSPDMFNEFYLPYIAAGCRMFGLVYYGCCERIDDRWEYIKGAIPNLRAVCVSPWNDIDKMGECLGKEYVYSGKTNPAYLSVGTVDWDLIDEELTRIKHAAINCNLELLVRDLYTLKGEKSRLKRWCDSAKKIFNM